LRRLLAVAGALAGTAGAAAADEGPAPGCSRAIGVSVPSVGPIAAADRGDMFMAATRAFFDRIGERTSCRFTYQVVSPARAVQLLKDGRTDIVPGLNQTPERDAVATFVRDHGVRPALITMTDQAIAIHSAAELPASPIRLGVVRGADYGPAYRAVIAAPALQSRLTLSVDFPKTAGDLAAGRIDATIATAPTFIEAARIARITDRIRLTPLDDLPAVPSGSYLVERALSVGDAALLLAALRDSAQRGEHPTIRPDDLADPSWARTGFEPAPR
jgi:polar amino acid transport system substrate-binding protein